MVLLEGILKDFIVIFINNKNKDISKAVLKALEMFFFIGNLFNIEIKIYIITVKNEKVK